MRFWRRPFYSTINTYVFYLECVSTTVSKSQSAEVSGFKNIVKNHYFKNALKDLTRLNQRELDTQNIYNKELIFNLAKIVVIQTKHEEDPILN